MQQQSDSGFMPDAISPSSTCSTVSCSVHEGDSTITQATVRLGRDGYRNALRLIAALSGHTLIEGVSA